MINVANPELALVGLACLYPFYIAKRTDDKEARNTAIMQGIAIVLIGIAAANPGIQILEERQGSPTATVLIDKSNSMETVENKIPGFSSITTETKTIGQSNTSNIGEEISGLEPNKPYLVASDLQADGNGFRKQLEQARGKNVSLSLVKNPVKTEKSVRIEGPEETVPDSQTKFRVVVDTAAEQGDAPTPEVSVESKKVDLQKTADKEWSFTQSFEETGQKSMQATIQANDRFKANNRFFKTVDIREKPEILVVGSEDEIVDRNSQYFSFETASSVPADLSNYDSVLSKKQSSAERLTEFVADGGGYVRTGEISGSNRLLPVKQAQGSSEQQSTKLMLLIDISISTEGESIKKSKRIAYNLVDRLPPSARVGALAYNDDTYLMSEPKPLAVNRQELKNGISRLPSEGSSRHGKAVERGSQILNSTGNLVLISDGNIPQINVVGSGETPLGDEIESNLIQQSLSTNRKLISVGVGKDANSDLLRTASQNSGGFYLDSSSSGRLSFTFDAGGGTEGTNRLVTINPEHFITDGLRLETSTYSFSGIERKTGSSSLVNSVSGKPFLTTWRYGIGRVAAFSGGTKDLERVTQTDPGLVTRTLSWSVGPREDSSLEAEDGRRPNPVTLTSEKSIEGFEKKSTQLYEKSITPDQNGIGSFRGQEYSYNYNEEIQEIGYNQDNIREFKRQGFETFNASQKQAIKEQIKTVSSQKVRQYKETGTYFLGAALLIILGNIAYRKLKGMK